MCGIKKEDTKKFLETFNKNKVSDEFLDSCKKAGELFKHYEHKNEKIILAISNGREALNDYLKETCKIHINEREDIKMKEMKTPLLATYSNGNTKIFIIKDGTRVIKWPDDEEMKMDFPVSMDFKITNWCNENCPMCHEMSNSNGKHGNIMELEFINHLHKGTEIAIGGGKVTSHPDLVPFLKKLKELGVLPSITVHQNEFFFNQELIDRLIKEELIYGLGVSFSHQDLRIWEKVFSYPNAVAHVIAGYHNLDVFDFLKKYDHAKVLILGYKNWGRGTIDDIDFEKKYKPNIDALASKLKEYINDFDVVSFDNLAIEQLKVKDMLSEKEWEDFYQGDDGTMTMYVDGVKEQFAKTSTSAARYGLKDTIEEMFKVIREGA